MMTHRRLKGMNMQCIDIELIMQCIDIEQIMQGIDIEYEIKTLSAKDGSKETLSAKRMVHVSKARQRTLQLKS